MTRKCCVGNCVMRYGRARDSVKYFRFPLIETRRKKFAELSQMRQTAWLKAINRKDIKMESLKHLSVCSKHFISGVSAKLQDYLNPDWVPSMNLGYNEEENTEKDMEEWKNWCRLCACDGVHKVDLFYKEIESNSTIAEDLNILCNLKLENATDLPSKICNNCNLSIKSIKDFVTNFNKTQELLTELLYGTTNDCISLRKKYKLPIVLEIKEEDFFVNTESICKYDSEENIFIKNQKDDDCEDEISTDENLNFEIIDRLNEGEKDALDNNSSDDENSSSQIKSGKFNIETLRGIKKENIFDKKKGKKKDVVYFQCKICEKKCGSKGGLTFHMKKKHSNISEISKINEPEKIRSEFWCKICGKDCTNKGSLAVHLKFKHQIIKDPNFIPPKVKKDLFCPHCDKKFTSESGRWSHIYTVHDRRMTVICEECGKEFSTKHHLLKHKIIHTEERNLHCPHCPASFKGKRGLAAHVAIHGESFPCSICGVVLNTKSLLKRHMIVHSDVKEFKCNFCHRDFKRSKNLYSHLITHIGIRTFECFICNQNFDQDMTYKQHLKITHPTELAEMLAKGERIPRRNYLSSDQLKAINEAAKKT